MSTSLKMSWAERLKQPTKIKQSSDEIIDNGDPKIETISPLDNGSSIKLLHSYTLWSHDINSKNWNISGYEEICTFDNVASFWKVINNFSKLGIKYNHFFIMKKGIEPIWEHKDNRDGGVCSFRVEIGSFSSLWEYLSVMLMCNVMCQDPALNDDINGISISPKNNWAIIKIWNKSSDNDLSKTLSTEILSRFEKLGIRYKQNAPEY